MVKKNVPKIVSIGGGTGQAFILKGLKKYIPAGDKTSLTAIVTVTDDGGSTGKIRQSYPIPAPGDIRNCISSLADEEDLFNEILKYRFDKGEGLKGHSLGNLIITALTELTGSFSEAIIKVSDFLNIKGTVLPVTEENVYLEAETHDGEVKIGETVISKTAGIKNIRVRPENAKPLPAVIERLKKADLIILGPGSLFTSIVPNIVFKEVQEAINTSKAKKIYVCNIMTQPMETDNFTAEQHLEVIQRYVKVDYIIVNSTIITTNVLRNYQFEKAYPVSYDEDKLKQMGVKVIAEQLVRIVGNKYLRHDSDKLAKIILNLYEEGLF